MRSAAVLCVLFALGVGVGDVRRIPASSRLAPGAVVRLAGRYDRSRAGRRLAARLWQAQVHFSPAGWRLAQLLVAAPVSAISLAMGASAPAALATAMTVTRSGGALLLRARRGAATRAVNAAAPQMARALATELAAWGSGGQALTSAARRCDNEESIVAGRVLQGAAARVLLGGDAASAMRRALADAAPRLRPTDPAARLAAGFALHRHDAAATAAALERFATALDADAAARNDVRAATNEVQMSALAVPVIAGATLVILLATDPAALAAAFSPPLLPLLGVAALIVAAAVLGVRRLLAA